MGIRTDSLPLAVLDGIVFLGLCTGLVVVVALILERWCRTGREQRWVWRTTLVLVFLSLLAELFGIGIWLDRTWKGVPLHSAPLIQQASTTAKLFQPLPQLPLALGEETISRGPWTAGTSIPIGVILGVVWLSVSAALLVTLIAIGLVLCRVRSRLMPLLTPEATAQILAQAQDLGLRRRLRIGYRPGVQAPFVFGLLQPTLVLPREFPAELTNPHRQAVILHELAHLTDHDPWWQLLADLLFAALWWHPLVWLMRSRWRRATESAADEASLRLKDGAILLAESLIAWQRMRLQPAWYRLAAHSISNGWFSRRIDHLLRATSRSALTPQKRICCQGVRTSLLVFTIMAVMVGTCGARLHTVKEDEPMTGLKVLRHSLLGLALVAGGDTLVSAQGQLMQPAGAPRSVGAAGKSEAGSMVAMGLNQQEIARFRELQEVQAVKLAAFREMGPGPERTQAGKALGAQYRESLQKSFSPEQYSRYLEYWEFNRVVIKHGSKKGQADYEVTVTAHPFDAGDHLFQGVKLEKEQARKIASLRAGLSRHQAKVGELVKTPKGLGELDALIGQMHKERNDQLKSILSEEQYQQYRATLNDTIQASWEMTSAARAAQGGAMAAPSKK